MRSTAIKDKEAQIGANCNRLISLVCVSVCRLQELEEQYRKEREEANNLLEQQRLVWRRAELSSVDGYLAH